MKNKNRSVTEFFVLVFVLSIPFWLLGIIYPLQLLPGLPIGAFVVLAPGLAAGIMDYRSGHLQAVRHLLSRSFDFNQIRNKYWYFVFVLFNPAIAILVYGVMHVIGRSLPEPSLTTFAVVPIFASLFLGALCEEIGWTGYATESLQRRWGTFMAGVLLGLAWAVFHLVVLTQANRSLEWIAWWSVGTVSLRIIMVWLYVNAGKSVFAAAIFHAMINLSWQLFPVNGSFYDPEFFSLATLLSAVIIFVGRRPTHHY